MYTFTGFAFTEKQFILFVEMLRMNEKNSFFGKLKKLIIS